jgi:pyruvate dehydrogenase E2 component (dihydrolipoamide acetyltransferase)
MPYTAIPNSMVRKVIARRLLESKQTVPHYYLTIHCDIDKLLQVRKEVNEGAQGYKISVNDFIIKAAAMAQIKVPAANVAWTEEAVLQYSRPDISVAVATPNGLITPIIKDAAAKSLKDISIEMKDLGARAREGKLKPQEFQGGTMSVTNLGMYGVAEFSAIINPPQCCILAVGAGEQRAVVKNGQVVPATVMTVTASFDHRAIDGAVGAEYLAAFKKLIEETPVALLL